MHGSLRELDSLEESCGEEWAGRRKKGLFGEPCTRCTKRIVPVGRVPRTLRIGSRGTSTKSWPTRSAWHEARPPPASGIGRDAEDAGGARSGTAPFDDGTLGRESRGSCGIRPFPRPTTRPKGICGCGRYARRSPAATGGSRGLGTLRYGEPGSRPRAPRGGTCGRRFVRSRRSGAPPSGFVRGCRSWNPLYRPAFHRPVRGTEFPIPKARVDYRTRCNPPSSRTDAMSNAHPHGP